MSALEDLKTDEAFVDVSLSCDGHTIQVSIRSIILTILTTSITIYGQIILQGHKVILSACSPYFKKILRDNPCRHPVLILNDMDLEVEILPNFFHLPTYLGYLPTYLPTYLPN